MESRNTLFFVFVGKKVDIVDNFGAMINNLDFMEYIKNIKLCQVCRRFFIKSDNLKFEEGRGGVL